MPRLAAPVFGAPILAALVILSVGFVAVGQVGAESREDLWGRDDVRSADPVPTPESWAFRCWPEVSDRIEPSVLLLGEDDEISVTLTITPVCTVGRWPVHTVLVLTGMEDRDPSSRAENLEGLLDLVDDYGVDEGRSWRMGVVVVDGDRARTVLPITGDREEVIAALRRWHSSAGGTDLGVLRSFRETEGAFARAADVLSPHDQPEIREIAILVGRIGGGYNCPALTRGATYLKRNGVLVITLSSASGWLTACQREVATSGRYAFGGWEQPGQVFRDLRNSDRGFGIGPRRVDLEIDLSDSFEYVDDTAVPSLSGWDRKHLLWSADGAYIPRSGVTYTFRVRSTVDTPGNHPIAARTVVSVWTNLVYPRYVVHRSVELPRLLVLEPRLWPRP